ncbi:hypothetical protein B0H10DRAFT_2328924 [Mycena sp. CBHHK59/15]|nr:hypothetical protein B0H10DRAFT_2328924 [Mycena sp. CBHHK59/15]
MPPKAKRLEEFRYNEDGLKAQCKVCAGPWITAKSAAKHLKDSQEHLKATELIEAARIRAEELENERNAASATTDLRSVQLTAPIAGTSSRPAYLARSGAEEDMWKDYETSGADFSAGNDTEDPPVRHEDLRKEADLLGLWNPEAVARSLGFGNPDVEGQILAEDEEEDFLSEIMRNAGMAPARAILENLPALPVLVATARISQVTIMFIWLRPSTQS